MADIAEEIRRLYGKLPKFPDGRMDFSGSDTATVVTIFVLHKGRLLLLRRSDKVSSYRGKWHIIGGYLDDLQPLRSKVLEELREEASIAEKDIGSIDVKDVYTYTDASIRKTWITQVVVVHLKSLPEIKIDWEHTEYRWISPGELESYDVIYNLPKIMKMALG